jgi:polar amino acid transport system substrate-binding protein
VLVAFGLLFGAASANAEAPLKTAVDGTFAPHAMPRLEGGIEGFNVDLANEIGRRLKRPVEFAAMQFAGILPALQAGTLDFVAAPVTVTKERAENYLFTEGYLDTDYQFLTRRGEDAVTDLKQLKGRIVAVNKGSAYDSWARDLEKEIGWTVESYGTQTDAVQAVLAGRAFANVAGNTPSNGRSSGSRNCSSLICMRPGSCGQHRSARIPRRCSCKSRTPSSA